MLNAQKNSWLMMKTIIILLLLVNFTACDLFKKDNPVTPSTGKIETGQEIVLTTKEVGSNGGEISITNSGSGLDGMKLTVPSGAYSTSKTFEITFSEITKHTFGSQFDPVTPLIGINNGGGYSNEVMTLKIPIQIKDNEFAMAFYYNDVSGTLEGIPIVAEANDYIMIATRHFSGSIIKAGEQTAFQKSNKIESLGDGVKIIVAKIIKEELLGNINSDYVPGQNDWDFPNKGSYIAPGGFCTGASLTSMWYYYFHPDTKLFGKYKDTKGSCWEDNRIGIRFASEVWCDLNWTQRSKFFDFMKDLANTLGVKNDSLQYFAFAYSMKISKQPQLIEIFRPGGGHAMVIYKCNQGDLFVADPNYPANTDGKGGTLIRSIKLANPKFNPYESRENLDEAATTYPEIYYTAKTSLIEWDKLESRWNEAYNNIQPSKFPPYKIYFLEGTTRIELEDKLNTDADSILIEFDCPTCQSNKIIGWNVYDTDGKKITVTDNWIKLNPGLNRIGFAAYGKPTQNCIGAAYNKDRWKWIDFRWVDIFKQTIEIETTENDGAPIMKPGVTNKEFTFVANTKGSAPKNVKFIWNFDDDTGDVTVINDSTVKHKFVKEGKYYLSLKMIDNSNGKPVGEALALATIAEDNYNFLSIQIGDDSKLDSDPQGTNGPIVYSNGSRGNWLSWMNAKSMIDQVSCGPLVWNKTSFSSSFDCVDVIYEGLTYHSYGTITGKLSDDLKTLVSLDYTYQFDVIIKDKTSTGRISTIRLANMPVKITYDAAIFGTFGNVIKGSAATKYITLIDDKVALSEGGYRTISNIEWDTGQTSLKVIFDKR